MKRKSDTRRKRLRYASDTLFRYLVSCIWHQAPKRIHSLFTHQIPNPSIPKSQYFLGVVFGDGHLIQ